MDYLAPLQFLKGVGPRRAADLQRAGLHTSKICSTAFRSATRTAASFQTIASLRPGAVGLDRRRSGQQRRPADAPAALQDLRAAGPRRDRLAARDLVQPAVPRRRLPPASARHPVRQAGADLARPAAPEPAVRDPATAIPTAPTPAGEPELGDDETLHTGRIVPVYEKTGTLTPKMQRVLVHDALAQLPADLPDPIPAEVLDAAAAGRSPHARLREVHFPAGRRPASTS